MLIFHRINDRNMYEQDRFNFIKHAEGSESLPYIDTKGIPTIGIGFNMRTNNIKNRIFDIFGINPIAASLTSEGKARELSYRNEIVNILDTSYPKNLTGNALIQANQNLQAALNSVMTTRYNDPLITFSDKKSAFSLSTPEMKTIFDAIMPTYQDKVDARITNIPDSNERIVLESLAFNTRDGSRSLLGNNLKAAIINNNRAEAWYEIRYNSNGDKIQGIANRRFQEAQLFGLRNDGPITIDDAKEILRMYARHELFEKDPTKKISAYESRYALPPGISSVEGELNEAKSALVSNYGLGRPIETVIVGAGLISYQYMEKTDADNIMGTDKNDLIFGESGNDRLYGGTGTDVIYGGEGHDQITGGQGNDYLMGGMGDDTYYFKPGDGNDWILDEDKKGTIIVENNSGELNKAGILYKTVGSANVWRNADNSITVTHNSPWTIVLEDGGTIDLGENLQDGDFGIHLINVPVNPVTTITILGDQDPGNTNDTLYDTAANDRIVGGAGYDTIFAGPGNDWLLGGEGMDLLQARSSSGDLIVEGGTDPDRLIGGLGNDKLFGERYGEMEALIAEGEISAGINERGDLAGGGPGNDFIYGTDRKDVLFGESGHDLIVGGGGDDIIAGDDSFVYADIDWSYTIQVDVQAGGTIYTPVPANAGWLAVSARGNDVIYAGAGNDFVSANGGDDEVYGGSGTDVLFGDGGNDFIAGGDGDDVLIGDNHPDRLPISEHGDDYLDGGSGNDTLRGYGGSDELFGGDGNDRAEGGLGDDTIDGEAGDDILLGAEGNDELFGGDGRDELYGDAADIEVAAHGDDYLDGEGGDDILAGQGGNDQIFGGDGNDRAEGGPGNDYIDGETGDDTLIGAEGADEIYGGDGNDQIAGDAANVPVDLQGSDRLDGGSGNDTLLGYGDDDYADGGADNDQIWGGAGNDELYGSDGSDMIMGDSGDGLTTGDDYLDGGAGDDILYGEAGNDTLFGGDGNDYIDGDNGSVGAGDDYLDGEAGNDKLIGGAGNNIIFGGDGNDQISVGSGNNYIDGEGGDDVIVAAGGNDKIQGGDGNDQIRGGAGSDTLDGGTGSDILIGETGNDTYLFGRGSGQDRIMDQDATAGNMDTILLGADILPSDIALTRNVYDLVLTITGTADTLTVDNCFVQQATKRVEQILFADGTVWDAAVIQRAPIQGTEGNDTLYGYETADFLSGRGGNDTLYGYEGDDILDGGAGNDTLGGSAGNDTYLFGRGSGQDIIYDEDTTAGNTDTILLDSGIRPEDLVLGRSANHLILSFTDATDTLTVFNWLEPSGSSRVEQILFADGAVWNEAAIALILYPGTDRDDRLYGSNAPDVMNGRGGDDRIYAYGGADTLDGGPGNDLLYGGAGNDTYLYGRGSGRDIISDEDASAGNMDAIALDGTILPGDVVLRRQYTDLVLAITGETDTLTVQGWFYGPGSREVENIRFADGTTWDAGQIRQIVIQPTAGDDTIHGYETNDVLYGMGGYDYLYGYGGNDTLDGGLGNDYLDGGSGNDTYLFGRGSGEDRIYDWDTTVGNEDAILLGENIRPKDVLVTGRNSDLVLSISGTGDRLTVENWFTVPGKVERIQFADGAIWDAAMIQHLVQGATAGDDYLIGTETADTILGLGGNDTIYTYGGDDILDGGPGSDMLVGGPGHDTYLFGRGSGHDDVYLWAQSPGDMDTILLNSGIRPEDLVLWRDHYDSSDFNHVMTDDLVVSVAAIASLPPAATDRVISTLNHDEITAAATDSLILHDWFYSQTARIQFADGTVWTAASLNEAYLHGGEDKDVIYGGSASDQIFGGGREDILYGNDGPDVLDGGAGSDTLYGDMGDDTLYGGPGVDWLFGGPGSDTYLLERGSGADTIFEPDPIPADVETIRLGNDIRTTDVIIERSEDTLLVKVSGTGDYVEVPGYFSESGGYQLDRLQFADGAVWDAAFIRQMLTPKGTEGDDHLAGTPGPDVLNGLGGNDELVGHDGDDLLDGGTGADTMIGGAGNDTYLVDSMGDIVTENADEGADTIRSSITYTLGAHVENLTLTGASAINGTGNTLDNVLTGNGANNTLNGGAGADTMTGGDGNDTYVVDNPGDVVTENSGEGTDAVQSSLSYTLGTHVENLTLTGSAAIDGIGNELNNALQGNMAANTLDGGAGADTMRGGAGSDTYIVDNTADVVAEKSNEGTDTILSSVTYTLGLYVENLTLTGSSAINGTGNTMNNTLTGNGANNTLSGGAGADTMIGGDGNDTYVVDNPGDAVTENAGEGIDKVQSAITYTLGAHVENLTLTGSAAINGTGNSLDNVLTGNSGVNVLTGGAGNDVYVLNGTSDMAVEYADEGTDTVQTSLTHTLGANIENLTLTGTAAINGTGNLLDNVITGNAGANIIDGGAGVDTMIGGAGNDTYVVDQSGDVVTENAGAGTDTVQSAITWTLGANIENLTLTGSAAVNGTGNVLNNVITGNAGPNTLDGGTGADTMRGGAGDDTYIVDHSADVVTENPDEGTDAILSSVSYTLGGNVENLTLTGSAAIKGTGNTLNNILTGNGANNTLNGGSGADTLIGGAGNDIYVVDDPADIVAENAGEGADTVQSDIAWTLGAQVENLTLTGASDINGTGNDLNNLITGNAGANILDGGTGVDIMRGGGGNDTYIVDDIADAVTEYADGGVDTILSSVTRTLGTNIENLILTGTSSINGTGNTLDNVLTGNGANNTLNGGAGADTMIGGAGNDIYVVENAADMVIENAGEGTDTVQSGIAYALGPNVENLTLTGSSAVSGTGNELNNTLIGNGAVNTLAGGDGNDLLNGGAGNDTMIGGAGDDTYIVGSTGDVVTENVGEGTDAVQSSVTYTLAAHVENLTLTGTSAIRGTGNDLDNRLSGNGANNALSGNEGSDTLDGGAGNDSLNGGTGGDTYIFRRSGGRDTISDYSTVMTDSDAVKMTDGISGTEPVIVRANNDLYLFIDANNYLKVASQFQSTNYGIERLEVTDGCYITRQDIETIVNTMSVINGNAGMDIIQKFNAMQQDQTYIGALAQSWRQP